MNVVLIGMKHCGKSTLGAALARRWQCRFHDVDTVIEATYRCDAGESLSVREIFARHGEDAFHNVEGQVVCQLYMQLTRSASQAVVALGGRTALNQAVTSLFADIGLLVYLQVSDDELFERISRSGIPSFLDPADPRGSLVTLIRERDPVYRSLADIVIDLSGRDLAAAEAELVRRLEEAKHAR